MADILGVGVEELAGTGKRMRGKRAGPPACGVKRSLRRGPTPEIQKQLEAIAGLPKDKRRFVEEVLANILKGSKNVAEGR